MGDFFTAIFAYLASMLSWVGELVSKVFTSAWLMATDLVAFALESLLGVAVSAFSAVDLSGLTQYTSTWGQLPAGVLEVLGAIGLTEALGIVVSAIGVRLILQLIPFTRLGS